MSMTGGSDREASATAFWVLVFGIPWYVKCQGALNAFWASKGAPEPTGV